MWILHKQPAIIGAVFIVVILTYRRTTPMIDVALRRSGAQTGEATRILETVVNAVAVLFAVAIAFVSLLYTFLAYPQSDDLARTGALRIISPWNGVLSSYHHMYGRWAAAWIEYSCYQGGHVIDLYPVMLIVLLLIGIVGCCCGIAMISGQQISQPSLVASGIVAYSFLWLSVPRGEIFYWFPASVEDWLAPMLGIVLLWLLYNFSGWWSKTLVVALSFLLPALHEVFGGWIVGVLVVTWLIRRIKGKGERGIAEAGIIAGTLSAASVVLAPGNRERFLSYPHSSLFEAFHQALHIERAVVEQGMAMVPILVVILLAAAHMRTRPSWYEETPLLIKSCVLVAMVPLPILILTPLYYALGGAGIPNRIYDGFYILFAMAAATFAALSGFDLSRWEAAGKFIGKPSGSLLRSLVVILAVASALSLSRAHAAFHEIDPAIRNRSVWVQRNAEIWAERNAGARDVVTSRRMLPLTMLPFYFDMTEDPLYDDNKHLKIYYGLQSIRLSKSLNRILYQPPVAGSETIESQCDLGLDSIPPPVVPNELALRGWTAISGKGGIAPDKVFLTLSNAHQKLYLETRIDQRLDVNIHFGQLKMANVGFTTDVDVSKLTGNYTLGLSRLYKGKLDSCQNLNLPLRFER